MSERMKKLKPWRPDLAMIIGLLCGLLLWWGGSDAGESWSDLAGNMVTFAAVGLGVALFRNRWRKVGAWDPDSISANKRGRV